MESKKISFGFSKIKKPALLPNKTVGSTENQVELIKCLEGQQIKLFEERKEETTIVIPLKENGKTSAALASLMRRRAVLLGEEEEPKEILEQTNKNHKVDDTNNDRNTIPDDLDKRAEREILADLKPSSNVSEVSTLVLPALKPDELPLDGAKESTLNDYETIPIEQYGFAMLRGMGWQPPVTKQKNLVEEAPTVRPKGMGLGADKALKNKPLLVAPEANEILEIKKLAYVRILGGKYKNSYGQIEGFDDDAGRIIVKLAIGGSKETFNEFLCQPVSKKEYTQYGKCINTVKYEQYKKLENEHGQIIIKKEEFHKEKAEQKFERHQENFSKSESNVKKTTQLARVNNIYKEEHEKRDFDVGSSSSSVRRARRRTRSRSSSRLRQDKSTSKKRYQHASSSDAKSATSTCESDNDSAYEQRHRHHKKSKSHRHRSKSSKKKHRHYRSSSSTSTKAYRDSSFSDEQQDRYKHKKNKKKTKKSKKQRSRTPSSKHRK